MKLGVFLPSYLLPGAGAEHGEQIRSFAAHAEDLGFESLFITDHLLSALRFYRVGWTEPLMTLAHVAAVTSRIQLGTSIVVLPTHNPVVLAKEIALDLAEIDGELARQGTSRAARGFVVAHENFLWLSEKARREDAIAEQKERMLKVVSDERPWEYIETVYLAGTIDEVQERI